MVREFLRELRIDPCGFDPDELIELFLEEMDAGLTGRGSSLPMIPAYVGVQASVPYDEPVIVIDAGGTNLRVCLVEFVKQGDLKISHFTKVPMPGTQGELSADAFYARLVDLIEPIASQSDRIGFCFSYPVEIQPDLGGVLLHWSKEVRVPELVGQCVAAGLAQALKNRELGEKQIVILNDTVACLLAGRAAGEQLGSDSFVGFILGTGTNTAYVEKNVAISKVSGLNPDGAQVVNVESGGFDRCVRGALDVKLDEQSINPGLHLFEKMISGVYLGQLAFELISEAANREFFTDSAVCAWRKQTELSWVDANLFLQNPDKPSGVFAEFSASDRAVLSELLGTVVDRAALFTAVNISAAAIKSGGGFSADHPLCINIDGSTYYKTHQLAEKVHAHLTRLLSARGIHYHCQQVEDAPIVGAAIAGLTAF